jgi:hypothetical protein
MGHLLKLFLALSLGVVAAAVNWIWLSSQVEPEEFVAAKKSIEAGEPIVEDLLKPIGIPGNPKELRASFIPYEERFVLFGRKVPRAFKEGDLLLYRDLEPPESSMIHKELGPFRLLSVGSNYGASVEGAQKPNGSGGSDSDIIAIAVPWPYSPDAELLMKLRDEQNLPNADSADENKPRAKIVGLHLMPSADKPGVEPADVNESIDLKLKEDERGAFISLRGIENVPRVLLTGQYVSFAIAVPAGF